MDVMRIDSGDGTRRFCICVASYGYLGDLMRESEKMRFLGPSRYTLAGALSLFRNKVWPSRGMLPSYPASHLLRALP